MALPVRAESDTRRNVKEQQHADVPSETVRRSIDRTISDPVERKPETVFGWMVGAGASVMLRLGRGSPNQVRDTNGWGPLYGQKGSAARSTDEWGAFSKNRKLRAKVREREISLLTTCWS